MNAGTRVLTLENALNKISTIYLYGAFQCKMKCDVAEVSSTS